MTAWTETEKQTARAMRLEGANSTQIGAALGRSAAAVRTLFRVEGLAQPRSAWLAQFEERGPIEHCPEQQRLLKNAVEGSAMLRDAILRLVA